MKPTLLPSPADYPANRLFALDLLRGIDMFYLAVVSAAVAPLCAAFGLSPAWKTFLVTHPWEGFTLYDLIMPLFIFMCGAAVPFGLGRRLGSDGRPGPGYWRHVLSRVLLLWVLGLLAQGGLETFDIHTIGFFNNTLQTIAVGYAAAAVVFPVRKAAVRVAVPLALLVGYGLLIHFGGDYTKDGNLSQRFDLAFWGALLPADNVMLARIRQNGYSWILPSAMYATMTLAGCYASELLVSKRLAAGRKAALLAGAGALSLGLGWLLVFCGVKSVKHIFTVSFTLQAIGWSALALAACYVVADIWKLRRGTGLLLLFGQFALAAYLCEAIFRKACYVVGERLFAGLIQAPPKPWPSVLSAVSYGLVVIAALVIWRGFKLARDVRRAT